MGIEEFNELKNHLKVLEDQLKKLRVYYQLKDFELEMYTIPQACTMLNISRATIYRLMQSKELKFIEIGGNRRIRRIDLMQCIERFQK